MVKNIHQKIQKSISDMLIIVTHHLIFYGEFSTCIKFIEDTSIETCGVNVDMFGFNYYYNPVFLDKLKQTEVNFVHIHELKHLLFDHSSRTIKGTHNHTIANYAQDMLINYIIVTEIKKKFVSIPVDKNGNNFGVFLPNEYDGLLNFESVYNWIYDIDKHVNSAEYIETRPVYGNYGKGNIECYSVEYLLRNKNNKNSTGVHIPDKVSNKLKSSMTQDMSKKILDSMKNRGIYTGSTERMLGALVKQKKDYLKIIKSNINSHLIGYSKHKTITRPSRKNVLGIKGNRKYSDIIIVILDTSYSMNAYHEKALSYMITKNIQIYLIQCDTEVKDVIKIKNANQLSKIKLLGHGGTKLQPAIDLVIEKYNMYNVCVLTDGGTDILDFGNIKNKVLILSTDKECPLKVTHKKIKQIILND